MLEENIATFLSLCETDAALQAFAKKRPFTLLYAIPDRGIEFYMIFQRNGVVKTGMGKPTSHGAFTIQMDEELFEGVMRGKIDGMKAALSGQLKFQGDPMKAMALQKINNDLNRLYLQAVAETGA